MKYAWLIFSLIVLSCYVGYKKGYSDCINYHPTIIHDTIPIHFISPATDRETCEFWYRAGRFDQLEAKPNTTNEEVKQDFKNDWLKQNHSK